MKSEAKIFDIFMYKRRDEFFCVFNFPSIYLLSVVDRSYKKR